MQNAKDTFYVTLRDRLAALNPSREVQVRGALRPAVVVAENELEQTDSALVEAFVMTWKATAFDESEPMGLCSAVCEIEYAKRGTPELSGMDRGRVLDAMDGELRRMLQPSAVAKRRFDVSPEVVMATQIFWSAPVFGAVGMEADRIRRTATVTLFALQEAGEA
ncbi:hypothetical protein Terro_0141 [Terriglobus roseus DSM 18391]|uniref:Uncharacterized protein n=1 Tax=Terriglobus roseus (strain DSM 18391 / NRRL B-41598 / KBS 63) TaxID=926566 RepID=I3ZB74_TERRK|nr:hypothetical protein [Terriglobus roseus]AFL86492.1 hypothetical protein Terro_0141 [Terriglobus roseus DSM 18391]